MQPISLSPIMEDYFLLLFCKSSTELPIHSWTFRVTNPFFVLWVDTDPVIICPSLIIVLVLSNSIIKFACSTLFSMYSFSGWSIERHATTWYSHANVTENDILFLFFLKLVVKLCAQHIFLPPALFCQFWKNDRRRNAKKKNATATL